MKRSPFTNLLTKQTITQAARVNVTTNGTGVDRTNGKHELFRSALVIVQTGTITDGTHTVVVQESNDNVTFTPVAAADLEGTAPAIGVADDNVIFEVGYTGAKRYVRVSVTGTGGTVGAVFGAVVVLFDPARAPAH